MQERDGFGMKRVTNVTNISHNHIRNKCFQILENVTNMELLSRKYSQSHKGFYKIVHLFYIHAYTVIGTEHMKSFFVNNLGKSFK